MYITNQLSVQVKFNSKHLIFWTILSIIWITGCKKQAPIPTPPTASHHPFLIVKKAQFDALRAKSDTEPWKSLKLDALSRSNRGVNMGNSNSTNAYNLQKYIGAAALVYILDEDNAQTHAERVKDAILNQYSQLELSDGGGWGGVVPPMGAFFVAILSLDIVYDALNPKDIKACEDVIEEQIFKIKRTGAWVDVRYGTHGTWDIYKGERTTPDDDYYESIMYQVTEDGVSPVTIHYAWERVGGGNSRVSKSGYMDVLEFTGIDQRYYQNERLQKFQRWLFGSSINTAKEMALIGDMLPTQKVYRDMLHLRVVNFDMQAAAYAAWFHEGFEPIGNILTYIIPKEALPSPQTPQSQLYTNGGAFFREKQDDPNGIHAVLYNIKSQDEWHTHNEVNGLALSGYGNRLMVNGGRLGAPTRPAPLNNTLTINGNNHTSRLGGGIMEGFTTDEFDYGSGFSGPALGSNKHDRSLLLIHAADGANAYCILLDEIEAGMNGEVKNYLHPANESSIDVIASGEEYMAQIDHYPTVSGAKLSFFYATPPNEVNIEKVPSAVPDRYPNYPDHNRLESVYTTDETGKAHILTVLFPHNATHSVGIFSRIVGENFSGGSIMQKNGVVDSSWVSDGVQMVEFAKTSFQGKGLLFRKINGENAFYFARKATHYLNQGIGFEALAPVSIYVKGNTGVIMSPGTQLTLKGTGVSNLSFDPPVNILSSNADSIEVELPEGKFHFRP